MYLKRIHFYCFGWWSFILNYILIYLPFFCRAASTLWPIPWKSAAIFLGYPLSIDWVFSLKLN